MAYFEEPGVQFKTAEQRRKLIGKNIKYLRDVDIDKSGRGYFFPRFDKVVEAKGRQLIFENGNSVHAGDLVEVVVVE